MKRFWSARTLTEVALSAALLVVCSLISVPAAVPFTLQTFGVFVILVILGWKKGCSAILLYILLGLIGLPVFSGAKGGPAALFGPTGGYILGFLLTGLCYRPRAGAQPAAGPGPVLHLRHRLVRARIHRRDHSRPGPGPMRLALHRPRPDQTGPGPAGWPPGAQGAGPVKRSLFFALMIYQASTGLIFLCLRHIMNTC